MPVSNPQKVISANKIACDGKATVTISFDASASISSDPADIILILDRSSSLAPPKIDDAKAAAIELVNIIANASGNGSVFENGTQMGLVSFSTTATQDRLLNTDALSIIKAINVISHGGSTNHRDAFDRASKMFPPKGAKRQIVVMFTDGITTTGGDPNVAVEKMKAEGIEFYCIGLGSNRTQLDVWASAPVDTHVAVTTDSAKLKEVFAKIAAEVVLAGAYDVNIDEEVTSDFEIESLGVPTNGVAQIIDPQHINWKMESVGFTEQPEKVSLSFVVKHIGTTGGLKKVNKLLTYTDRDGNTLTFPSPEVDINCPGNIVVAEPCPQPTAFVSESCKDAAVINLADTEINSTGRVIEVNATIKNVCPGKEAAAAIFLTEEGTDGVEHNRGLKTVIIPAIEGTECQDVELRCINFVVPDELNADGTFCNARNFKARVIVNYIDTDFKCCENP